MGAKTTVGDASLELVSIQSISKKTFGNGRSLRREAIGMKVHGNAGVILAFAESIVELNWDTPHLQMISESASRALRPAIVA